MTNEVHFEGAAAADTSQYIICRIAEQDYGIRITAIREIIRLQPLTVLPDTPDFVEGIISFRGEVNPIIDLRKRLGLTVAEHTEDSRIIILDFDGRTVGVIVDAVTEVETIESDSIDSPDSLNVGTDKANVAGIGKVDNRLIIVLRLENVVAGLLELANGRADGAVAV